MNATPLYTCNYNIVSLADIIISKHFPKESEYMYTHKEMRINWTLNTWCKMCLGKLYQQKRSFPQ